MDTPLQEMTSREQVREWLAQNKFTNKELKSILVDHGYPAIGNKDALERAIENIVGYRACSRAIAEVMDQGKSYLERMAK